MEVWCVRSGETELEVEAEGWLDALGVALPLLGVDTAGLGRLECTPRHDGGADVRDPASGLRVRVDPVAPPDASGLVLPPSGFAERLAPVPVEVEGVPEPSTPLPDDIVEDLWLRLGGISAATGIAAASGEALRIVLDYVSAGAGAVLIRTRAGDGLRFRAASGPAADKLIDTVIPLDKGIAGYVCQLGVGIEVQDAQRDRRHNARVDRKTGYTTHAMLALPVRADSGGAVYGCLELLNPKRPFTDHDFEVATRVAASLGTFLDAAYAER